MHHSFFGVALPIFSGKDKAPLNFTAGRTHESPMLVARNRFGVVLDNVHQVHLYAAVRTTHCTYSLPSTGFIG